MKVREQQLREAEQRAQQMLDESHERMLAKGYVLVEEVQDMRVYAKREPQ